MMTGRITDAYTNIATVKLFSHAGREAGYARTAMHEFLGTVHAQMRLVSGIEVTVHGLSMLLILGTAGVALWLWSHGEVGVGALAAATAMALRLNGMSHWVMWEMASLFENVGLAVRERRHGPGRHQHLVAPAPGHRQTACGAGRGEPRRDPLRRRVLCLRRDRTGGAAGHRPSRPGDPAGREDRRGRPFRRRQVDDREPAAALLRRGKRADPDRRPEHRRCRPGEPARADRHGHPGHFAVAPLGARQHPVRPARRYR